MKVLAQGIIFCGLIGIRELSGRDSILTSSDLAKIGTMQLDFGENFNESL